MREQKPSLKKNFKPSFAKKTSFSDTKKKSFSDAKKKPYGDSKKRSFSDSKKKPFDSSRKTFSDNKQKRFDAPQRESSDYKKKNSFEQVGKFPGVYCEQKGKWSNYFVKGSKPYFGEKVAKINGTKYRQVEPERSKLFAGIAKGISQIGFKEDSSCLYLGASHGYTVSFLLDMLTEGEIYALDFAPRVVRDLVFIAQERDNVAPLMADANQPDTYKEYVPQVDVVFMDIAQKNQVEIFSKNCDMFLKSGGFGLLALKARSVDVTKQPKDIFKQVRSDLEKKYVVVDYRELAPFEKDHAMFVIKKK